MQSTVQQASPHCCFLFPTEHDYSFVVLSYLNKAVDSITASHQLKSAENIFCYTLVVITCIPTLLGQGQGRSYFPSTLLYLVKRSKPETETETELFWKICERLVVLDIR